MNRATPVRRIAVILLLLSQQGCYSLQPLGSAVPAPRTRVVATLTDSGTVALGNAIGSGAVELEGVVADADEGAWQLQMLRVTHRDGRTVSWNRESLTVPRNLLIDPNVRRLDRTRSWLAAGVVVGSAILLAVSFSLLDTGEGLDTTPVPPAMLPRR